MESQFILSTIGERKGVLASRPDDETSLRLECPSGRLGRGNESSGAAMKGELRFWLSLAVVALLGYILWWNSGRERARLREEVRALEQQLGSLQRDVGAAKWNAASHAGPLGVALRVSAGPRPEPQFRTGPAGRGRGGRLVGYVLTLIAR